MMKVYTYLFVFTFFFSLGTSAQLSGTYTINNTIPTGGANFNNFSDAFMALNGQGVGGSGATFLVSTGQVFYDSPPILTATGTATAPIKFIRSGSGSNPKIIPSVPGIHYFPTQGHHRDGVIRIAGGDHIEFNAIDIAFNPLFTTSPDQYEYGYYLLRNAGTDACKHITIANCTITLYGDQISKAIFSSRSDTAGNVTTPTGINARAENLVFRKNTITAPQGIYVEGFNPGPGADILFDHYITIDSNQINLDHSLGLVGGYGIKLDRADSLLISHNTIFCDSSTTTVWGIEALSLGLTQTIITHNNISLSGNEARGIIAEAAKNNPLNFLEVSYNKFHDGDAGPTYAIDANASGINNVFHNEIYNIVASSFNGITTASYNTGSTVKVFKNHIYNVAGSFARPFFFGQTVSSTSTHMFENNVHDITGSGFSILSNTPNFYCYNNFISRIYTPNSTSENAIRALESQSTVNQNYFYNTVYLDASSNSPLGFGTSCLYLPGAAVAEVRNNIFVNMSVPGPFTGYSSAIRMSNSTLNLSNNSNNNCLYAGAGPRNVLFYDGSTYDATIIDYHTRMGPVRESNSFSAMPPFINVTTPPYDLHINPTASPNPLDDAGTPVTTPILITTDIDGQNRSAITTDVGADEFSIPLPLKLLSFNAARKGESAMLSWLIKEGEDNSHYEVQASKDGVEFERMGVVNAFGTEARRSYEYEHRNAAEYAKNGAVYYRLKLVDVNGGSSYSNTRKVVFTGSPDESVSVYPNPVNASFFISIHTPKMISYEYSLISIKGELISTRSGTTEVKIVLPEDALKSQPAGIYVLNLSVNGVQQQYQLIKR